MADPTCFLSDCDWPVILRVVDSAKWFELVLTSRGFEDKL